jgi:hypothetical protein
MWFPRSVFEKFNSVLRVGALKEADQILVGVLQDEKNNAAKPGYCPHCKKNLVHQALPYLEVFVHACPEKHGFWMTPENSLGLKKFINEQLHEEHHQKNRFRLLIKSFFLGFAAILIIHLSMPALQNMQAQQQEWMNQRENERISATYWPLRKSAFPAVPAISSVDTAEELVYLEDWAALMAENVSNRLNMEGVLQTERRPQEYQAILSYYLRRQTVVFEKMAMLTVPEKLNGFHAHALKSIQAQMRFYTTFAMEKAKVATMTVADLSKNPDLIASAQELQATYQELMQVYPDLDARTHAAIQQRLNWAGIV